MLRGEVEAARSWGVPWSVLKGRVVRPGDPLFTTVDTSYAVALAAIEGRSCACGQDRTESMDPENEFAYKADAYRCHACAARDRAVEAFQSGEGSSAGLMWAVQRKDN